MNTPPRTFPKRTEDVIPLIEKRLLKACEKHAIPIHYFTQTGDIAVTETVDGDIAIPIACRIIERLLRSGTLLFEGHGPAPLHARLIVKSIEHEAMRTYGDMVFFNQDIPQLLRRILRIFLSKQHALVRPITRETLRLSAKTIRLPPHTSLQ